MVEAQVMAFLVKVPHTRALLRQADTAYHILEARVGVEAVEDRLNV
jgi:hypothetical protein